MRNKLLGNSGLRVSELCLGSMTFGRETDEETSAAAPRHLRRVGRQLHRHG